jgi:hypothetical protein
VHSYCTSECKWIVNVDTDMLPRYECFTYEKWLLLWDHSYRACNKSLHFNCCEAYYM